MATTDTDPVIEIQDLFDRHGQDRYGESVTQLGHALQTAALATEAGAAPPLVAAALLHDIGHLLSQATTTPEQDDHHEHVGARWLEERFGTAVSRPVALHVVAKRYLCAVEPTYLGLLSPASVHSLQLQGGPLTPSEVSAVEQLTGSQDAVALRRWDDEAKDPGATPPPLTSYLDLLHSLVLTP